MARKIHVAFLFAFLISSIRGFSQPVPDAGNKGPVLPFVFVDIAGPRPTISYMINGKAATSMIHSNASQYLQLSPENAGYFGLTGLVEDGVFGISEPGKVNKKYKGRAGEIKIGNLVLTDKPVSVFNKYPPDAQGFGMLGRSWIRENRIVLDYKDNTVAIQPDKFQQDSIENALLKEGYVAIPMDMDSAKHQYFTSVSINGVEAKFTVSTVSSLLVDSVYAGRANIAIGKKSGSYAGPTGQTGFIYDSKEKFKLRIGQFETTTGATIEDSYKYSEIERPTDRSQAIGGTLGADFMIQNKAVIDFGNLRLYLKKASK